MSSNNPESQGQDWPIYPGTPGPSEPRRSSESRNWSSEPVEEPKPVEERYAQDDAYRAYQSYAYQQPTEHRRLTPHGHQHRRPNPSSALQKKYVWIVIGIVAALVITSIARGGFNVWPLVIFGGIAWWIVSNKRKC